ncbi:MAG: hypothetical protein ACTSQE_14495 [Candidatus Heimdallarchaeaceae archaeon]
MYPKERTERYNDRINYNESSHHALLRIEREIKEIKVLLASFQTQQQDTDETKANLIFEYNKLTEFKEERDKLRQTVSFKCYWDVLEKVWVFEGKQIILDDFVQALKDRGIPLEVNEVKQ